MKVRLMRLKGSSVVRIPRDMIEQCGLGVYVELTVRGSTVVISAQPLRRPREGWEESFKAMAAASDDALLLPGDLSAESDETEWTW